MAESHYHTSPHLHPYLRRPSCNREAAVTWRADSSSCCHDCSVCQVGYRHPNCSHLHTVLLLKHIYPRTFFSQDCGSHILLVFCTWGQTHSIACLPLVTCTHALCCLLGAGCLMVEGVGRGGGEVWCKHNNRFSCRQT